MAFKHINEACQCEGKYCPQCKEIRCHGCYTRDNKRRDGLDAWCKSCNNARRKAYRETNAEKARQMQERAYRKNLGHYRNYQKTYREMHREEINRKRREEKYHATETAKAKQKIYKRTHGKEYRRVACIVRRARKRNVQGTYTVAQWRSLKVYYNYTCLCCGKQEPEIKLTVDHVIPLILGGSNSIENLQPLCLSCNSSKQAKTIDYRKEQRQWLSQLNEPSNMKVS